MYDGLFLPEIPLTNSKITSMSFYSCITKN